MNDELKPCPFCGGKAKHYHRPDNSGWSNTDWVCCSGECGASTCLHETKENAVAAWNTRAEVEAAVKRALEGAADCLRELSARFDYDLDDEVRAIRQLDPAQFVDGADE